MISNIYRDAIRAILAGEDSTSVLSRLENEIAQRGGGPDAVLSGLRYVAIEVSRHPRARNLEAQSD